MINRPSIAASPSAISASPYEAISPPSTRPASNWRITAAVPQPIHQVGITAMGLWILDNAWLDDLSEACATRNRWEFLSFLNGDVLRYIALLQRVDIVVKRGVKYKG